MAPTQSDHQMEESGSGGGSDGGGLVSGLMQQLHGSGTTFNLTVNERGAFEGATIYNVTPSSQQQIGARRMQGQPLDFGMMTPGATPQQPHQLLPYLPQCAPPVARLAAAHRSALDAARAPAPPSARADAAAERVAAERAQWTARRAADAPVHGAVLGAWARPRSAAPHSPATRMFLPMRSADPPTSGNNSDSDDDVSSPPPLVSASESDSGDGDSDSSSGVFLPARAPPGVVLMSERTTEGPFVDDVLYCYDSDDTVSDATYEYGDDDDDDATFGVDAPPLAAEAAAAAANHPVPAFVRPVGNTHEDIDAAFSFMMTPSQHARAVARASDSQEP